MKKGFTLIELLAVIVILAIIALIATPIVLNIIKDSRESAGLRSAEMYLDAVEQAVSIEKMNNTSFNPNSCDITKEGNLYCEGYEDKIEVEVKGEKPINGNITFEEGKITNIRLEYKNDKVVVKDEDGNLIYEEEPTLTYTSLGNYQHQTSAGVIEAHIDKDVNGACDVCAETEIPGLYKTDGTFVSWGQLTSMEYCTLTNNCCIPKQAILTVNENGVLTSAEGFSQACCDENLSSQYLDGKLVISNNVTSIGNDAFHGCTELTFIAIPDSVTSIGNQAFDTCTGLKSLYIPASVTTIKSGSGFSTFLRCSSNLKIYCESTESQSGWGSGWNIYSFNGASNSLTLDVTYGVTRAEYEAIIAE